MDMQIMFSEVKEITRTFTPRMGSLKSRDGKVIGDEEGMKTDGENTRKSCTVRTKE